MTCLFDNGHALFEAEEPSAPFVCTQDILYHLR